MDVNTTPDLEAGVRTDVDAPSDQITSEMEPQAQVMSPADRPEKLFFQSSQVFHASRGSSPRYPYHEQMNNLYLRSRSHRDLVMLLSHTDRLREIPGPRVDMFVPFMPGQDEYSRLRTQINLTIVEHMVNAKSTFTSVSNLQDLRTALATKCRASQSFHRNDQPTMRLYIVEDLSADVVELLGSRYNIDPLFFGTQYDFRDSGKGDLTEALRLQVSKKHRKWFHIANIRMSVYGDERSWRE
jgi:hypothetical protein